MCAHELSGDCHLLTRYVLNLTQGPEVFDVRPPTRVAATRTFERPGAERRNTQYLAATDSVHTAAAVRDYPEPRLAGDDTVVAAVSESRDGADALNVAGAVLAPTSNELIVGTHARGPRAGPTLGTAARRLIEGADLPMVAVPLSP